VDTHTQTLTLEGDEEITIPIPGLMDAVVVITRKKQNRRKLIITMPVFMKATKGKYVSEKQSVAFRVVN